MAHAPAIAAHWERENLYATILSALKQADLPIDRLTVEDLAPLDHFHARGFPATVELADALPVRAGQRILDIGCGLGGPARYMAWRFGCKVQGVDITTSFVDTANRLTALLGMQADVVLEWGDGSHLPFDDHVFDAAYTQHVTMNVADRPAFFAEAFRVIKPGGVFALTEHGLGPRGTPYHPVPWSADGSGEYLATPSETRSLLAAAGFRDIVVEDTGERYLEAYRRAIARAQAGDLPALGIHLIIGETWLEKTRNSARNIAEGRTHPIQVVCRKP